MLRDHRHHISLALAVIAIFILFALYEFSTSNWSWKEPDTLKQEKNEFSDLSRLNWHLKPDIAQEAPRPKQTPMVAISPPEDKELETMPIAAAAPKRPVILSHDGSGLSYKNSSGLSHKNGTNNEKDTNWASLPSSTDVPHWIRHKELYPVPTESLIKLPTGKATPLPKIQHTFQKESAAEKADRETKLNIIRSVFQRSWKGYKDYAWLQDELRPMSGGASNPFAGWGATLVDSLDTLWIMGLKEEFAEAAEAVNSIDFTTATRIDIPMFETTIRYLGGLIAAYDISGKQKKYKNLLDKAVELAEVLFSAFDTPNRMPEMYYYWQPELSSYARQSSTHVVLAEIGSLSVEFTRLAQLTGDQKYYDAIARITNNLEEYQNNTRLPGMWPSYLDASGCKRIDWMTNSNMLESQVSAEESETEGNFASASEPLETTETEPTCEEQGFASSYTYEAETYTMGALSDSAYEYLPKQYILLGGRVEKYRTMFEKSMEVAKEHLIYRPMLPNGEDILFSGILYVPSYDAPDEKVGDFDASNTHLTCFIGGMFGLGAKLFERSNDLEIAKKLTEGCVWSYNMTATGIMPEVFNVVACEGLEHCEWNQTQYELEIDPWSEQRLKNYKEAMELYDEQMAGANVAGGIHDRPQVPDLDLSQPAITLKVEATTGEELDAVEGHPPSKAQPVNGDGFLPSESLSALPVVYSPQVPLSHKDYVKSRIEEDRLPPGVVSISARDYVLRPEAIESVWYMYRITGDPYWRHAGWRMFEAVNAATSAEFGNSAIDDVTKTSPLFEDVMESFWLAETLKYFYLLFEKEDVVSLDEWVLNTEAHPFRRE